MKRPRTTPNARLVARLIQVTPGGEVPEVENRTGSNLQGFPHSSRDARHGVQHRRQQVGVLVRIQVRRLETGVENAPNLRDQFVIDADAAESQSARELGDGRWKRRLADQHQVDADIERGILAREADGVVECRAGGHQRGGGEDAGGALRQCPDSRRA